MSFELANCVLKIFSIRDTRINGKSIELKALLDEIEQYFIKSSPEYKKGFNPTLDSIEVVEGFPSWVVDPRRFQLNILDKPAVVQHSFIFEDFEVLSGEVYSAVWYILTNVNIDDSRDPRYAFIESLKVICRQANDLN